MLPVLFSLGPFTLHTYGVLVALGFLAAIGYSGRLARREGIAPEGLGDLGAVAVASALVGSRLLYVAFYWRDYLADPLRIIFIWEGGLVFHGGLLLAVPACWIYVRRAGLPPWRTADVAAPGIALGQAIGRLGCLAAGCCHGSPTDLPWGITFTDPECLAPIDTPLHPTQLFASLSALFTLLVLRWYRPRRRAPGQVFWLYLILASLLRFVEDFLRAATTPSRLLPGLTAVQAILLVIAPVAFVYFVRFGRREQPAGEPPDHDAAHLP